jgi:hypothetical protein
VLVHDQSEYGLLDPHRRCVVRWCDDAARVN